MLAQIEAGASRAAARWAKPVCVHVDGVVRAAEDALPAAGSLYGHLGAFSGPANALHRSEFGVVTSTLTLSRDAMNDEVAEAGRRRTAFAVRNDDVAGGLYEGQGRTGGRATRLEGRVRARAFRAPDEVEPLSDSEGEADRVKEAVAEAFRAMSGARGPLRGAEVRLGYREVAVPDESKLMLLRHIPCPDPFNPGPIGSPVADASATSSKAGGAVVVKRVAEGDTLAIKKLKKEDTAHLDFLPSALAGPRPVPSTPRPAPGRPLGRAGLPVLPPSSRSSSVARSSLPPATPPSSYLGRASPGGSASRPGRLGNPFASQDPNAEARARKAATLKPAAVAGRKPLPAAVSNKVAKPLFQQPHH